MNEFKHPLRVYIEDTDAGGIVYYVNYLKFMERARTEFFRSLGYHKAAILGDGHLFVVHGLQVNYQRSAFLDDALEVSATPLKVARTYVEFEQKVYRLDKGTYEVLCDAQVRIACINSQTRRPAAIPESIHEKLVGALG